MYDISNLDIGGTFFLVSDIYEFMEFKVVDKNIFYIEIVKRDMLRFKNSFLEFDGKKEWIKAEACKEYFYSFEEAEQAYLQNVCRKKEKLYNREILLKSLYDIAFQGSDDTLEADLYKKHINTILYTYKRFDY